MKTRAQAIASAGSLERAIETGTLPKVVDVTLSEALVLGLLKQNVHKYLAVFGHGSTELAEVLRVYGEAGVVETFCFRNEVEMAHAATALRWVYGEIPAVVTSIGPGALQAMAGSLAASSNGLGLYHIYGDETTHGEGYNMQQIPKPSQGLYGQITALMGESFTLHTPEALRAALRRGAQTVFHPYKAVPFYLMFPINTQPMMMLGLNLTALPGPLAASKGGVGDDSVLQKAAALIQAHRRIVIKAGGGCRQHAQALQKFADVVDGVVTLSPGSLGVLPDAHPRNMHVGGSKGSISGNYAMEEADLVIVVGSRAVCQADCSGVGYKKAQAVININGDLTDATHYNRTLALTGDISVVTTQLVEALKKAGGVKAGSADVWLKECAQKKKEWAGFKSERYTAIAVRDEAWGKPVLTQPAALKIVCDFAKSVRAIKYFDAGDVQANGFQIAEDDAPFETITESGASYMGFAASALLASGLAEKPRYGVAFCGDGSFMMNPQVLIDGVEHKVHGTVVIFDNRRMAAISGLQVAQYGKDFSTNDHVAVDYVKMAESVSGVRAFDGGTTVESLREALKQAHGHKGLSVIHVPVYWGPHVLGGMGAYGSWNVGPWCQEVQARYHAQEI